MYEMYVFHAIHLFAQLKMESCLPALKRIQENQDHRKIKTILIC